MMSANRPCTERLLSRLFCAVEREYTSFLRIQRAICRRAEFFRSSSPHRFALEPAASSPRRKWVAGRAEETKVVPASTWLETLELSLSREWRLCNTQPRTYPRTRSAEKLRDGYSINREFARMPSSSPSISDLSNSIHPLSPVTTCMYVYMYACVCVYVCMLRSSNSFRTRFREFLLSLFRFHRHTQYM